jgi:hypothetical protein
MGFLFNFGTIGACRDAGNSAKCTDLEELSVERRGLRFALPHIGPPVRTANARPATEILPRNRNYEAPITSMGETSHKPRAKRFLARK